MKKIVSVLASLLCVFGLSVMSFAYKSVSPENYPFLEKSGGHYKLSFVLPISKQSESIKQYWFDFTEAFSASSNGRAIVTYNVTSTGYILYFHYVPLGKNYTYDTRNPTMPGFCMPGYTEQFTCLRVTLNQNCSFSSMDLYKTHTLSIGGAQGIVISPGFTNIPDSANKISIEQLELEDDLGGEEPDTPSSSSEPDTPSSGGWQPPVVSDPEIPAGDEYVFYDTAVLKQFLNYVRDAMGKAINVGWLIFGFILMWLLIKKVIKSFSSR